MKPIAYIRTDFPTKFGIPRQSGLIDGLTGLIRFEKEYRDKSAFRGIEDFSHLWLIWEFSLAEREGFSTTVRPPRLGGNTRVGVFASRSPFRPNPIGLSCVKLLRVFFDAKGPALLVSGIDMADNTPILDIKPYIPISDCRMDATGGYTELTKAQPPLSVDFPDDLLCLLPKDRREAIKEVLASDPRPAVERDDPERSFWLPFCGYDIRFHVFDGVLHVEELILLRSEHENERR